MKLLAALAVSLAVTYSGLLPARPTQASAQPNEQFVDPPGPITPEETKLLEAARAALGSRSISEILTDHTFNALHPRTEFRELIRDHAKEGPVTIAAPDEPGERLTVTGIFRDEKGKPLPGVLMYFYQTSAKGWYAATAAHVRANSGDHKHARLFGYLKTGADGKFEIQTIRPGGYPRSDLPQHIHIVANLEGYREVYSEFLFDDDPRLTKEQREQAKKNGFIVSPVTKGVDGTLKAEYVVVMKNER